VAPQVNVNVPVPAVTTVGTGFFIAKTPVPKKKVKTV
jgi:hypothetical protein